MGKGGVKLFVVVSPFAKALLNTKLAVSVLGLEAVGWIKTGPRLKFFVERADTKEGMDCDVVRVILCPCCTVFLFVSLSRTVALTGTSLRPLGGNEGQNPAVCLVGGGEELIGRSRGEKEDEEPMMVWASEEWSRERRKPRKSMHIGAMVSSDWSLCLSLYLSHLHPSALLLVAEKNRHRVNVMQ